MKNAKQIAKEHCERYTSVTGLEVPLWVRLLVEEACSDAFQEVEDFVTGKSHAKEAP